MNKPLALSALVTLLWAVSAQATPPQDVPEVTLRHLSTTFVNHGICSIRFGISSEFSGGDAGLVEIQMNFLNPEGQVLHRGTLATYLEDTTAGRYQEEFVEGENICFPAGTRVEITAATATIDDVSYDLIELGKIREDRFKPYQIQIKSGLPPEPSAGKPES